MSVDIAGQSLRRAPQMQGMTSTTQTSTSSNASQELKDLKKRSQYAQQSLDRIDGKADATEKLLLELERDVHSMSAQAWSTAAKVAEMSYTTAILEADIPIKIAKDGGLELCEHSKAMEANQMGSEQGDVSDLSSLSSSSSSSSASAVTDIDAAWQRVDEILLEAEGVLKPLRLARKPTTVPM